MNQIDFCHSYLPIRSQEIKKKHPLVIGTDEKNSNHYLEIIPYENNNWLFPPLQKHEGNWDDYTIFKHSPLPFFAKSKKTVEKEIIEIEDGEMKEKKETNEEPLKEAKENKTLKMDKEKHKN